MVVFFRGFNWVFSSEMGLRGELRIFALQSVHQNASFKLSNDILGCFHFFPFNGGVPFFQTPGRWGQTVFLEKKKNVGWFVMTKGT